jgi:Predicted acyltransferases
MKAESILTPTLWYYLFFTANIPFLSASGIWIFVHYWSIGVEEQYYLFWPWVVKYAKSNLIKVAVVLLVLFFGCKIVSWVLFSNHSLIYRFFAVTSFHSMMLGGIGAILYYKRTKWFLLITTDKRIQLLTWVALVLSGFYAEFIPALIRNEYIAFISLFLIMGQVENKKTLLKLENKGFDYIGKISYGIYVIHPLIIYLLSSFWRPRFSHSMPVSIQYPLIYLLVCILTIIVAALSYKFYESPFLRLKDRFAIIKSSGSSFFK